jgi:hypothetical protein
MNHKDRYVSFSQKEAKLPLFLQPWYLDAVCEEQWDVVTAEKGGQTVAVLPYFLKKKGPFYNITMPLLTKFMGTYVREDFRHPKQYYKLCKELIEGLPKVAAFKQNAHYSIHNWLPFYWEGFRQTTYYSYQIRLEDGLEAAFSRLSTDYRNNKIPRAEKMISLDEEVSLEEFHQIAEASYQRQKMAFPVSYPFLEKLDQTLAEHESRKILGARDQEGRLHSALYLVWDKNSAYDLMAGDDPALRQSGAGIWLSWQAIRYTSEVLQLPVFDFLGSMKPSIERVRRNFGAHAVPYFRLERFSSPFWAILNFLFRH